MSDIRTRQAELIEPVTPLWQVLAAYPALLTEADVLREIAADEPPTFLERDRVEIGVNKLLSVGVLRREGDSLVPTPATLFLDDHLGL
jgi:hypothetical protein